MIVHKNPIDRSVVGGGYARGNPPRSSVPDGKRGGSLSKWGSLKATRVPSDRRNSGGGGKARLNRHALSPSPRLPAFLPPLPPRPSSPGVAAPLQRHSIGWHASPRRQKTFAVRTVSRALTPVPSGRSSCGLLRARASEERRFSLPAFLGQISDIHTRIPCRVSLVSRARLATFGLLTPWLGQDTQWIHKRRLFLDYQCSDTRQTVLAVPSCSWFRGLPLDSVNREDGDRGGCHDADWRCHRRGHAAGATRAPGGWTAPCANHHHDNHH